MSTGVGHVQRSCKRVAMTKLIPNKGSIRHPGVKQLSSVYILVITIILLHLGLIVVETA